MFLVKIPTKRHIKITFQNMDRTLEHSTSEAFRHTYAAISKPCDNIQSTIQGALPAPLT